MDRLEISCVQWGIFSVSVVICNNFDVRGLEGVLKAADLKLNRRNPDLARQTIDRISIAYGKIADGVCEPEYIARLGDHGRILPREVAGAPEIMLYLGWVRKWDEYMIIGLPQAEPLTLATISIFMYSGFPSSF